MPYNRKGLSPKIKLIDVMIEKKENQALRDYNITNGQVHLMVALSYAEDETCSLKQLEELFHFSQATIAGIVSRLESKQLVEPVPDENDRRIKKIRLTEAGRSISNMAKERLKMMEQWLTSSLSPEEAEELERLLNIVYRTVIGESIPFGKA